VNLKPCPYRRANADGQILCDKIKTGDREVNAAVCRACPIAEINCAHLRATLEHHTRPPIIVRWGNGKSEVWDDFAQESLTFARAACAERVMPITSPRDCVGCTLRQALTESPRAAARPATPAPRATARAATPPTPEPDARSQMVAQKIIQLQEWLTRQARSPQATEETREPTQAVSSPVARRPREEKRVGWTD
jgi:hypothetical protein